MSSIISVQDELIRLDMPIRKDHANIPSNAYASKTGNTIPQC